MKITLIMPKMMVWTGAVTLPLNLAYLASAVKQDGHEVKCLDMRLSKDIDVRNEIKDCDVVGISSSTPSIKEAWKIAKIAKEEGKTTILGGPHASALPDESLSNDYVDIVVRGEGEETLREVCSNKKLDGVLGISYKKNGKIIHNSARPFISNLDALPFPARHLFDLKQYHSNLHKNKIISDILTSRGCPYNCNFCYKAVFGRIYRMRSPENVVKEWKEMLDLGIQEIGIIDDNFSVDRDRAMKICELIIKQNLKTDWSATGGLRVDTASSELFKAMRDAGCYRVAFGVESGDQDVLDKVCKGIKLDQVRNAVKLAKEAGFETTLFFMIGNIYDNEETVQKSIDFAKELDPDFVQFTMTTPFPGTQLYDLIKKEGKLLVSNWEEFGQFEGKAYFEYKSVTKEFSEKMWRKAYKEYYLRPKIIYRHLKKGNFGLLRGLKFLIM